MNHMPNFKASNVLCWNIRWINSVEKWDSVRDKVVESGCDIFCLQETKREFFYLMYIRKFSPSSFDSFSFVPSVGNSGGILIVWKSSVFSCSELFQNRFAISMEFTSLCNGATWILTGIYGSCIHEDKRSFLGWLLGILILLESQLIETGLVEILQKCFGSMR